MVLSPLNRTHRLLYGRSVNFQCAATGVPAPSIKWYKNGLCVEDSAQMIVEEDGTLQLNHATVDLSGEYKCVAKNLGGKVATSVNVDVYCKMFSYSVH